MTTRDAWSEAGQILCVRLDSMGDFLMTTPAIRALRAGGDDRRITLLASPAAADAAALVPAIDEVIVYDAPWTTAIAARPGSRPEHEMAAALRDRGFDAAVIFTGFNQSALPAAFLCYLADIPLRLAHCRENPHLLLTDWVVDREPESGIRHEVRRQLDLVASVGSMTDDDRLSLRVPEGARGRVMRLLADQRLNLERPWVVIHPGASAASRRYPPELYARVAGRLTAEYGWQTVFTGVESERGLVARIRAAMGAPSLSFAGRLSLADLTAMIQLAPLLITNNTGPAHIAAATGTPVVDIYALTNPRHTPWRTPARVLSHDVPCKNCYQSDCPEAHHNCLRGVTPESVVAAARDLHGQTNGRRPLVELVR